MELVPVQVSSRSHSPAAGRHTVPALPAGCRQETLLPSQRSRVHGLPSLVHVVPDAFLASAGHAAAVPEHVSGRSHSPAAERQTVLERRKVSAGHAGPVPEQRSSRSQTPAADRHTVVEARKASTGQSGEVPVHRSSASHPPASGRQRTPALPGVCVHKFPALHTSTVHGLASSQSLVCRHSMMSSWALAPTVKGALVSRSMTSAVAVSPSGSASPATATPVCSAVAVLPTSGRSTGAASRFGLSTSPVAWWTVSTIASTRSAGPGAAVRVTVIVHVKASPTRTFDGPVTSPEQCFSIATSCAAAPPGTVTAGTRMTSATLMPIRVPSTLKCYHTEPLEHTENAARNCARHPHRGFHCGHAGRPLPSRRVTLRRWRVVGAIAFGLAGGSAYAQHVSPGPAREPGALEVRPAAPRLSVTVG